MSHTIQFKSTLSYEEKEDFCLRKQVELYYFLDRTDRSQEKLNALYCESLVKQLDLVLETPCLSIFTIDDCVNVLAKLCAQLLNEYKESNQASSLLGKKNMEQLTFYIDEVSKQWQQY
jgi:hypothetical protein